MNDKEVLAQGTDTALGHSSDEEKVVHDDDDEVLPLLKPASKPPNECFTKRQHLRVCEIFVRPSWTFVVLIKPACCLKSCGLLVHVKVRFLHGLHLVNYK